MNTSTSLTHFIDLPAEQRRHLNGSLRSARNTTMLALIGSPRSTYGTSCEDPTDPQIVGMVERAEIGSFAVRGLRPAVAALRAVFADIKSAYPEIHDALGTVGMLCCRLVRGSATAISNHSWGTAIDLTVGGQTDIRGDGKAQAALRNIHPIFNSHGFFWGAAFGIEDAMHFEASEQMVDAWSRAGEFGDRPDYRRPGMTIGDRGPGVELLQLALNRAAGNGAITIDGIFGKETRAAVIAFQRDSRLPPDGIATARTRAALGIV